MTMTTGDLQQTFGKNLRDVRHAMGLSQEALSGELGFHRTFIGSVERGERNLTLKTVERMSEMLRTNPLALLGGKTEQRELRAARTGSDPGRTRKKAKAKPRTRKR